MLHSSAACERNKEPILAVLRGYLDGPARVLEIGGGTGQHAVWFGRHLPDLVWQSTDRPEYLDLLAERVRREGTPNVPPPLRLDVRDSPWPVRRHVDAVFTANTLHIMSWDCVRHFFRGIGEVLNTDGWLLVYGPFRYRASYTSASNASFDRQLRTRNPASGIRDFEAVEELAAGQGLDLVADHAMPANNQMLVWCRAQ